MKQHFRCLVEALPVLDHLLVEQLSERSLLSRVYQAVVAHLVNHLVLPGVKGTAQFNHRVVVVLPHTSVCLRAGVPRCLARRILRVQPWREHCRRAAVLVIDPQGRRVLIVRCEVRLVVQVGCQCEEGGIEVRHGGVEGHAGLVFRLRVVIRPVAAAVVLIDLCHQCGVGLHGFHPLQVHASLLTSSCQHAVAGHVADLLQSSSGIHIRHVHPAVVFGYRSGTVRLCRYQRPLPEAAAFKGRLQTDIIVEALVGIRHVVGLRPVLFGLCHQGRALAIDDLQLTARKQVLDIRRVIAVRCS